MAVVVFTRCPDDAGVPMALYQKSSHSGADAEELIVFVERDLKIRLNIPINRPFLTPGWSKLIQI